MTTIAMTALPLTPIHVGDGTTIGPESYFIQEAPKELYDEYGEPVETEQAPTARLVRFSADELLNKLTPDRRNQLLLRLDSGDLRAAQELLRRWAWEKKIGHSIAISSEANRYLSGQLPVNRAGEVHLMVRSGGVPYLPGSSIKGAIRTALASHFLGAQAPAAAKVSHEEAMRAALALTRSDTADDPLRFVSVGDVMLPEESTRIDQVDIIACPGRNQPPGKIKMHYERLKSVADTDPLKDVPRLTLSLGINEAAFAAAAEERRARAGLRIGRRIDRDTLFLAVNRFHQDRWKREHTTFRLAFPSQMEGLQNLLESRVSEVKLPKLGVTLRRGQYILLRIGRFGHFESKSLDGVRRGHFPQRKGDKFGKPGEEGGTRSVVRIGGAPIPFGWLLAYEASVPARNAA